MIDCDPCNCIEGYYRDEQSWRKAMIVLLCDIETSLENYINLENLWDKTAGVIHPHTATDNVLIPASLAVTTDVIIGNYLEVGDTAYIKSTLTIASNVIYENLTTSIYADTSDTGDSAMLQLSGGGAAASPTRGATIYIAGNERASYTGSIKLESGDASGSKIEFLPGGYVGWNFNRTASHSSHELVFGRSDIASSAAIIRGARNDGSDDGKLELCGGGAASATRGSHIILYGNEQSSGHMYLNTGQNGSLYFYTGDTDSNTIRQRWYIPANNNTSVAELVFGYETYTTMSATIRGCRADGSDDGTLQLTAGGAVAASRGAYEILYGNESGGHGNFVLGTGDKADASGYIRLNNSLGLFYIQAGTNTLWSFEYDGDLQQNASYGGNLVFNKSGKGVCDKLATLAATGSGLADAAQIVSRITIVSGADDTKGVKLPTDAPSGAIYRVINPDTMYQVAFYPGSSSHQFVNLDAGGGILISTMTTMSVVFDGTDTWYLISIGE